MSHKENLSVTINSIMTSASQILLQADGSIAVDACSNHKLNCKEIYPGAYLLEDCCPQADQQGPAETSYGPTEGGPEVELTYGHDSVGNSDFLELKITFENVHPSVA